MHELAQKEDLMIEITNSLPFGDTIFGCWRGFALFFPYSVDRARSLLISKLSYHLDHQRC